MKRYSLQMWSLVWLCLCTTLALLIHSAALDDGGPCLVWESTFFWPSNLYLLLWSWNVPCFEPCICSYLTWTESHFPQGPDVLEPNKEKKITIWWKLFQENHLEKEEEQILLHRIQQQRHHQNRTQQLFNTEIDFNGIQIGKCIQKQLEGKVDARQ